MRSLLDKLHKIPSLEISPRAAVPIAIVALLICVYFLFHAAVDKPHYAGEMAGKPTGERMAPGALKLPAGFAMPPGAK
jgi:hypothetical protein